MRGSPGSVILSMDKSNIDDTVMSSDLTMEADKRNLFTRRKFVRNIVYTGVAGSIGSFAYARWVEPNRLAITEKEIHVPHLPDSLDGTIVAQLTDFHYEPDQQDKLMAKAVAATNAFNPDIIALTGDFITQSQMVITPLMSILSGLKARHGIYSILGNHDGWHGQISEFKRAFRTAGIEFLHNQGTRIKIKGEHLFILGTDSIWSGSIDAPACYRGHKNEPVLALVHEPDVFDILAEQYPVGLQLSGHTHGGQCRVPLIGYAPVTVRYGRKYIYGEFSKGDSRLFVSRGLGTVGTPVRFACVPEVVILTLRSKDTLAKNS